MTKHPSEHFLNELLTYYEDYILIATFDSRYNLILYANPYLDFERLVVYVCDSILNTIAFDQHLNVHLHEYGKNDYVKISIN